MESQNQAIDSMENKHKTCEFLEKYEKNEGGIRCSKEEGYWSNLDQNENDAFIKDLQNFSSAKEAVKKNYPQYYDIIFSPKREAGLELLDLKGDEVCVDYGCMWGALTVPLAKRTRFVLGVDQTLQSLVFLKRRVADAGLKNVELLCENLNKMPVCENKFDVAIVNGVLEWVPEKGAIELKQYYGKKAKRKYSGNPKKIQVDFLTKAYQNLNKKGKLYLAIENRYDFKMFFGVKDPHSNLMFTSILPRKIANFISLKKIGRPYINWLYSFSELRNILKNVGFNKVDLYCCFPDYHFPEFISPYDCKLKGFKSTITIRDPDGKIRLRRLGRVIAELFLFKHLKIKSLAPSIIAIAQKD